jgi:rhamnosyltransferase
MAARTGPILDITSMTGGERVPEAGLVAEAEPGGGTRARDGSAGQAESSVMTGRMRVLAHVHTFNDADIIDRTIAALRTQTRPVDGILVVDNASTDGTLAQPSVTNVTVLRHPENQGTSGTVYTGMRFALDQGYDWIWVFDADSAPEPDALAKLLALYDSFPERLQEETAFLACIHYNVQDWVEQHAGIFTRRGMKRASPNPEERFYPCHVVIWSGCLYRVAALREIGLPNPDYVLDWGEGEYGYRIMKAGYKGFVFRDAVMHHNIRGHTSVTVVRKKFGPAALPFLELAPIRCYYSCRNPLYFALYDVAGQRFRLFLSAARRVFPLALNFVARPISHGAHVRACLRGLWHGFTGNITARY